MQEESGAGAFGGDHGGAEGLVGGAARAEVGASGRLELAERHLVGGAMRGVAGGRPRRRGKPPRGVVGGIFGAEGQSAPGHEAEAAPLAVGDFEDGVDDALGFGIAAGMHDARIRIDHFGASGLEQPQDVADAEEDVGRLEAGDGDGPVQFAREGDVGIGTDDGADVAGGEEGVGGGLGIGADGAQEGRDEELRYAEADVGKAAFLGQ